MSEEPDWNSLQHAYGAAGDIPQLLENLSPDPEAEVWGDLWSRVCHQGTVYSASFPTIPYLLKAATGWSASQRVMPLFLVAMIVVSDDVQGCRNEYMKGIEDTIKRCRALAMETLRSNDLAQADRIYLLESVLALNGDAVWGQALDGLVDGSVQGLCPHCRSYLYIVVDKENLRAESADWPKKSPVAESPIAPVGRDSLPEVGTWLLSQAEAVNDLQLARWITYLFGSTNCPNCDTRQGIPTLIEQYLQG